MIPEFWGVSQVGWQALAALTGIATLLIAAAAAVVAYNQFRVNQVTRDDQSRPYVIADFEPSQAGIVLTDFVIRNIGKTPALDVQIRLTPPPARANETTNFPLARARIISGTLPMMAPGRELRLFFDSMPERYSAELPMSFEAKITYKNSKGKSFAETATVDMDSARGSLQTTIYGMHHAAKALRSIDKNLDVINRHLKNPIHVTTENLESYEQREKQEREEMLRQHEELRAKLLPQQSPNSESDDTSS
jgi:hypothetical protein